MVDAVHASRAASGRAPTARAQAEAVLRHTAAALLAQHQQEVDDMLAATQACDAADVATGALADLAGMATGGVAEDGVEGIELDGATEQDRHEMGVPAPSTLQHLSLIHI